MHPNASRTHTSRTVHFPRRRRPRSASEISPAVAARSASVRLRRSIVCRHPGEGQRHLSAAPSCGGWKNADGMRAAMSGSGGGSGGGEGVLSREGMSDSTEKEES